MSFISRFWMPVVLALLAAFTWWLQNAATPPPTVPPTRARVPDYEIEGMIMTAMNIAGKPDYRLSAATMKYYRDEASAELTAPHITSFRDGDPPWTTNSERGLVTGNGDTVLMLGQATLHRPAGPQGEEMTVVTRDLTIRPKQSYAETSAEVTATMGRNEVQGIGMHLFLAEKRVQLFSHVRGMYVPAP